MKYTRLTPFFVLLALLIIVPNINLAHASIPIFVGSVVKDCSPPTNPCSAPSINTNAGDRIMVTAVCWGSTLPTVGDSLSTTYTLVASISNAFPQIWTGTSSGGADVVSLTGTCSSTLGEHLAVDVYRFVTGIGVTNQDTSTQSCTPCPDSLTMIIQVNSFIYEVYAVGNTGGTCAIISGSTGQAVRDTFSCDALGGTREVASTMDRQYSNGGSTTSTATTGAMAGSSQLGHFTIELLASGGSVTQLSNCYGNCGTPAVTTVNTNSTKSINFNLTQTFFYENQILFPALILNESATIGCTYGTAQCPNANTLILSLYVTQTQCIGAVPFTTTCPGTLVFQGSVVNPKKGLFTIQPNYSVFQGQWIALAFSASSSGMNINDTNTAVNIFNTPGTPSSLSQATAQGTSKANVYAWATGNTIIGGGITPAPSVCINSDFSCFMIASACALTPSNCFIGGTVYLFIYFVVFVSGVSIAIAYVNREYEYEIHLPPALFFLFFLLELFMFTAMGLIPQYVTIVIFLFTALGVAGYFGSSFAGRSNKAE